MMQACAHVGVNHFVCGVKGSRPLWIPFWLLLQPQPQKLVDNVRLTQAARGCPYTDCDPAVNGTRRTRRFPENSLSQRAGMQEGDRSSERHHTAAQLAAFRYMHMSTHTRTHTHTHM